MDGGSKQKWCSLSTGGQVLGGSWWVFGSFFPYQPAAGCTKLHWEGPPPAARSMKGKMEPEQRQALIEEGKKIKEDWDPTKAIGCFELDIGK